MSRVLPVVMLMLWSAAPAAAADEAKETAAEHIIAILHEQKLSCEKDLRTTPYRELMDDLEKKHKVIIVTAKAKFGEDGANIDSSKAEKLDTKSLDGTTIHGFLKAYLEAFPIADMTYVVRADYIEITTNAAAREEAGLQENSKKDHQPKLPLICVAVKDKQLGAVLDDLRRIYGVNVVVETGAKVQLKTLITEQLLNVPVDIALELLAGQADLGVVRKGNTFRITSNPKA